MSVEFTVKKNDFPKAEKMAHDAIEEALKLCGQQCADYAAALAPVDTSTLKNSIEPSKTVENNEITVGTNVEYAIYQELGTSKMSAANGGKGYMRPALNEHKSQYERIVATTLKTMLS